MLQIVRNWVVKLNKRGPDGLIDGKAPKLRSLMDDRHRAALVKAVEDGPIPAVHGVVRWRVINYATGCVTSSPSPYPSRR